MKIIFLYVEIPAYLLRKISKGTFYSEYFVNDDEKRVKKLEDIIKYYGFRTDIEKRNKGYFLRIYGDSQREVDDFINLYIKQNFKLLI